MCTLEIDRILTMVVFVFIMFSQ